jgi:hypothetical protein
LLTYSFGVIKWSKTNLQNINIQTRVLFTKFCKHHPKSAIERFNLPRENGGRGFSNLEILQHNQIASLKNYFLNRARDNTFFNALVSADKVYTPLNLSDNIISDIVEPNITDTIANIKQKSLHGRYFKELEQPEINIQASHAWHMTYNTKINKYLELSVAMRNLWCLEKNSILPFIISATGIVPQSLFKNLKILDLENTLVVEIQKGILLYSCHIVRKFLNIDTEHKTQKSQNVEARRR